ncbi:SGNH/GDSL hydrolase family protein [Nocardia otitidiscaviarum]|nr:SGNH/GDSL hydrolase family protein [Nocardia otitidiscaviarum]MCP9618668.1 SGNH/GDSL hydrolase family protein [Nocardia otitidiscaviarum]
MNRHVTTEADDPMVLSAEAIRDLLAPLPWRRFAVLGDSTAAGTGDPWPGYETLPWPERLARALRAAHPEAEYLNTAVMGASIATVRDGQLRRVLDFRPDLVHLSCGGNDLLQPDADLARVERDLDELCAALTATGARLSLFTFADAFTGHMRVLRPRFVAFAETIRRIAARHEAMVTEFWDHPARRRPDWLSADRIHLSMAGQAVAATEIAKTLARQHSSNAAGNRR